MSLVPKSSEDFSSKDYWNEFFAKRGTKSFEWYGDFTELCELFLKYVKKNDTILMSGCGNSTLSGQLSKVGYSNITNVDVSEIVIRQMKEKYSNEYPNMKWLHDDMLNLKLSDGTFTCVIDKGTLDALLSTNSEENMQKSRNYFKEINRILHMGGRYVCISLLQEHIMKSLNDFFPSYGWMMRICRCKEAEVAATDRGLFSLPVFVVVCTKFKILPGIKPILELHLTDDGVRRVENFSDIVDSVTSLQQYSFIRHSMRNQVLTEHSTRIELCNIVSGKIRFVLHVIDNQKKHTLPFAVFIVPQGREIEWIFCSNDGHRQLAESSDAKRLVIVHLQRDEEYPSMVEVKDELASKILELAPAKIPFKYKVPFLSTGEDLGERITRDTGSSLYSGKYIVEDIKHANVNYTLRRLIFLNNPNIIQSEAKLFEGKRSKAGKMTVDRSYLACSHHAMMVAGLQLVSFDASIMLIGLGGGLMAMFINKYFPKTSIVSVDIDEAIVNVAKEWFGFSKCPRLTVHVQDGIEYVQTSKKQGKTFDLIMFDVDSKDSSVGLSCPPRAFLEKEFLQMVSDSLSNKGCFVLNLVCRDMKLKSFLLKDIKSIFLSITSISIPEEVNCILFCFKKSPSKPIDYRKELTQINKYLRKKYKFSNNLIDLDKISEINTL